MPKSIKIDLTNLKFGKITVLSENVNISKEKSDHEKGKYFIFWNCRCDCGKDFIVNGKDLRSGNTRSCGCIHSSQLSERNRRNKKHGLSQTYSYCRWSAMMDRCYKKNNANYHNYGGRGITVCKEWHDVKIFYRDMGDPPSRELELDRIDVNKGYYKHNCRWVSKRDNCKNRRVSRFVIIDGERVSLSDVIKKYNAKYHTVFRRLKSGWDIKDALTRPTRRNKYKIREALNYPDYII